MKASNLFPCLFAMLMSSAHAEIPEKLLGTWTLQIESLQHEVITTLTAHFTDNRAKSCLGGDWKQIIVDSHKTSDGQFFPVDEPLSYEFDKGKLTIGRNEVCDAYLQLSGELNESNVDGEYVAFGWGSKQLGYFSLKRGSK